MDSDALVEQIARGALVALIPNARPREGAPALGRRWHSMQEVAEMLGFGLSKVKMLVIARELRSVKVGKYRRILPEWVDEYVARQTKDAA